MKGLVAVPVYNEAESLHDVIEHLRKVGSTADLLFVDDGSKDQSGHILLEAGVPFVSHPGNRGYAAALRTAMEHALANNHEYVVFFDADGQHRVEDLLKVIDAYEQQGYDMVIGSRFLGNGAGYTPRQFGTRVFSALASWLAGTRITDATSGLKLIAHAFLPLALMLPVEDMHAELIFGLARAGARIHEVGIQALARRAGVSMYSPGKALMYPFRTLSCLVRAMRVVSHYRERCETGAGR